ncbi:MAG: proprotein convertase P-domain-containing protein [Archangium sp.]|nr:proprotein convertase P-domain-containing protein [Archangium sp.]
MLPRLLVAALFVSACGADVAFVDEGDFADGASDFALSVSTADTAELLAFVNHPTTTLTVLDGSVGLDVRAAKAILAHRDGADAVLGTADDDLFGSLSELDAVSYVGDAALKKLVAWALAHPVAKSETVEGVAFTSEQVSAVIWGVNQSTSDELDDGLQLETRAASNLLTKRPYASIAQMGAVSYVGAAALTKLRDYAPVWAAKRAGAVTLAGTFDGVVFDEVRAKQALKLANVTTYQGLVDGGLPATGAAPIVGNRPYTSLAQVAAVSGVGRATMEALLALALVQVPVRTVVGDGAECDGTSQGSSGQLVCGVNLVCAGISFAPTGICRPSWMANTFRSGTQVVIPDGVSSASVGMTVTGMASVAEDVIVHLEITHPRKSDLRIVLTQPSSAESVVWNVDSNGDARVVMGGSSGVERDSQVNGVWFLTVFDTRSGSVGTLDGWSLELTSRMD